MSQGLGRGLSSLIPQKTQQSNVVTADSGSDLVVSEENVKDKILQVEVEKIAVNPMQPRQKFTDSQLEELVKSIKDHGIIQPLIVSRDNDKYELIAGERRLRSAKIVGLKKVPVIVRDARTREKLELALIENIQREDLNPIDLAVAYKKLVDEFGLTQEEVAKQVGKSRPSVTNALRLLNLPEEIKLAIIDGRITEGHAKYLAGLDNEEKQMSLFRRILHNKLSVSDTNQEAKRMGGTKSARIKINYADKPREFAFREFFGAKAEIKRKGRGGQIVIDFYSDDELEEIVNKIK